MRNKLNEKQKEKIIIIVTLAALMLIFTGITYAFFTANNPEGSTAQIISTSGRMLLNYNDGTDNIVPITNIQPSNNILVDKTFSLTGINTTSGKGINMPYVVSIEYQSTFINEYVDTGKFLYFISLKIIFLTFHKLIYIQRNNNQQVYHHLRNHTFH